MSKTMPLMRRLVEDDDIDTEVGTLVRGDREADMMMGKKPAKRACTAGNMQWGEVFSPPFGCP